jgi:hypothetical protein
MLTLILLPFQLLGWLIRAILELLEMLVKTLARR